MLDQFSVYKPDLGQHPNEFAPLHHLCVKQANNNYYFDGLLGDGERQFFVQKVPFTILSIGNYCDTSQHEVGDQMWIQSVQLEGSDTWYQLRDPAPEYQRYHTQFVWLANFAKHFIDYLSRHAEVHLHDFRGKFYSELEELHGTDTTFHTWLRQYGDTDFRRVVSANPDFLHKEAVDIERRNDAQPIWFEIHPKSLTAVRAQKVREGFTVVTPFVYNCFKALPWGKFLSVVEPNPKVLKLRRRREKALHLTVNSATQTTDNIDKKITHSLDMRDSSPTKNLRSLKNSTSRSPEAHRTLHEFFDEEEPEAELETDEKQARCAARADVARTKFVGPVITSPTRLQRDRHGRLLTLQPGTIRVGDVIGVDKDAETIWKGASELWFAYVQGVKRGSGGQISLDVIWLYAPSDTTCSIMQYPIHNELFFSDNCNCGDGKLDAQDVVCKATVGFFSEPGETGAEFIVRQKYRTDDAAFVTLRHSDFTCIHRKGAEESRIGEVKEKYQAGDTVLYRKQDSKGEILEPVVIVEFKKEGTGEMILVRRLLRRDRDFPSSRDTRPNELVYTDDIFAIPAKKVQRRCHVRFYTEEEKKTNTIPSPYNRNGTADAYYITCRAIGDTLNQKLEPLTQPFPQTLIQGFDPCTSPPRRVLDGMDLYCGGGNFGRGLEEGGAVHNKWAVDYDRDAIHTYNANLKASQDTALYFGSVNDLLAQALKGRYTKYIPEPGEVDFISAGSPCQGFSNANQKRTSEKSLRNSSLVASVAAFVDFYRPKYALLENVVSMASKGKKNQDQNVFSQLLCSLVGMGYQVQQFNLDAWSFGSPQSRSRLFISIAAPGLELPPHPALSHSHPPSTRDRGLGVAANGISFGMRRFEPTPFQYVTAGEGTADLPHIGDARTQTCVPHPDHRNSRFESYLKRVQITQIPVAPRAQTFMLAFKRGRLGKPQVDEFRWDNKHKVSKMSKSWQRVDPNGLMPTITTSAQPSCSFTGTIVHWDQHRLLTIMEARRAQSFPDQDVLVGHPRVQWKLVGNSVARTVAVALGMSLREAWLANEPDSDGDELELVSGRQTLSVVEQDVEKELGKLRSVLDSSVECSTREGFSSRFLSAKAESESHCLDESQLATVSTKRSSDVCQEDVSPTKGTKRRRLVARKSRSIHENDLMEASTRERHDLGGYTGVDKASHDIRSRLEMSGASMTLAQLSRQRNVSGMASFPPSMMTTSDCCSILIARPPTSTSQHLTTPQGISGASASPIVLSDDDDDSASHAMSISNGSIATNDTTVVSYTTAPGAPISTAISSTSLHQSRHSRRLQVPVQGPMTPQRHGHGALGRSLTSTPTQGYLTNNTPTHVRLIQSSHTSPHHRSSSNRDHGATAETVHLHRNSLGEHARSNSGHPHQQRIGDKMVPIEIID